MERNLTYQLIAQFHSARNHNQQNITIQGLINNIPSNDLITDVIESLNTYWRHRPNSEFIAHLEEVLQDDLLTQVMESLDTYWRHRPNSEFIEHLEQNN